MIKKRSLVEGPHFGAGDERLEDVYRTDNDTYDLYHVAEDGSSVLVVTEIADAFELQDAVAGYGSTYDLDAALMAIKGRAAANARSRQWAPEPIPTDDGVSADETSEAVQEG